MNLLVNTAEGTKSIQATENETVLQAMKEAHIPMHAPCSGRGTCGKCRIRIQGENEERLACQTYPSEDMVVTIVSSEQEMQVLSDFKYGQASVRTVEKLSTEETVDTAKITYMVAIDLGTTTVVQQLLAYHKGSLEEGKVLQTIRSLNPQRLYGADVISRITAANHGAQSDLTRLICELITDGVERMCQNNAIALEQVDTIAIGGNTTMIHLLRGYDVSGLGIAPFQPVTLSLERFPYAMLKQQGIGSSKRTPPETGPMVVLLPGISAFVGGDIVAGLYALEFHKQRSIQLLVDLGTNGELAIGNEERILVTSTAAGPAFEGGNISCGTGSISGAIKEVTLKRRYVAYQTIDNKAPVGLCGTGAVELLAELLQHQKIDVHGSLIEEHRANGFTVVDQSFGTGEAIRFTQEDIRQMQLAKGAIRAGIEVLLTAYGVGYDQIDRLYLAGGMGFSLNIEKACSIGLLPKELKDRVTIVGNSCLGGVKRYLQSMLHTSGQEEELTKLVERCQGIQLAEEKLFHEKYLSYMEFMDEE